MVTKYLYILFLWLGWNFIQFIHTARWLCYPKKLLCLSTRNIRKITNNSVQKYQLKHFLNTLLCFSIPLKSKTSLAFTNEHSTAISSQLHDLPTFQVHYEIWFSLFECLLFRLLIGCTTESWCMRHVILYWAFIDIA